MKGRLKKTDVLPWKEQSERPPEIGKDLSRAVRCIFNINLKTV
jgi:hypothetical protein